VIGNPWTDQRRILTADVVSGAEACFLLRTHRWNAGDAPQRSYRDLGNTFFCSVPVAERGGGETPGRYVEIDGQVLVPLPVIGTYETFGPDALG
jgi:hypothetical protein